MGEPRPDEGKKVTIDEIVGYKADTYISEKEIKTIQSVFGGPQGKEILAILRKIMLPTVLDPNLPIEEMGKDMFMQRVDFTTLSVEESKAISMGLQLTIKTVLGGLIQLKQLAMIQEETAADKAERIARNSNK